MPNIKTLTKQISWRLDQPLCKMRLKRTSNQNLKKILRTKIRGMKGKKMMVIQFMDNKWVPLITTTIAGDTIGDAMKAIAKNVNTIIKPSDELGKGATLTRNNVVYSFVAGYRTAKLRRNLITKYENKRLKVRDMLGNSKYFEAITKKGKNYIVIAGS